MLNHLTAEQVLELHEKAPCGYVGTALDGKLLHANETFAAWVGRSKADLYTRNVRDLLTTPSQLLYDTYYLSRLQLKGAVTDIYLDFVQSDQAPLPVLLTSVIRRGKAGAPDVIISTMFNVEERQRYEREVMAAKRRADTLADVVRYAGTGILTVSFDRELTSWNMAAERLFNDHRCSLRRGSQITDLFSGEFGTELIQALENNSSLISEVQLRPDSLCRIQAFILSDGFGLFIEDITEQKAHEVALMEAHDRFSLVTRATTDGIWDWNVSTGDFYLSARMMGMLDLEPCDTVTNRSFWTDRIPPPRDFERVQEDKRRLLSGEASRAETEYRVRRGDGSWFWLHSRSLSICNTSGTTVRIVGSVRDVTKGKVEDSLTGLHTRTSLLEGMERRLSVGSQNASACAVLFLDLDGFKRINDGLGHQSGDLVLQEIGTRLRAVLSSFPLSLAARLGGDEFVLLLDEAPTSASALNLAQNVHSCLQQALLVDGRPLNLSASIGVALSTNPRVSAEEFLRNADVAMYRAKASGRAQTSLFTESMQQEIHQRMELEGDLRLAVKRNELELFYQPKIVLDGDQSVTQAVRRHSSSGNL
ncbi:MAG: diguanylate cyclase domain-containing protein [Janthinobacterium lividum]